MRKAVILYNPVSGGSRAQRLEKVEAATAALRASGIEVISVPTQAPDSAGAQAQEAIVQGHDLIFAAGGDGTMNDVLQGMVAERASGAVMGLVPLGTGNVLANDLRLPRDPAEAVHAQLDGEVHAVSAGHVECKDAAGANVSRYFMTVAGVGPDAYMLYRVSGAAKGSFGMAAYVSAGLTLGFTHKYPWFEAEMKNGSSASTKVRTSQIMAVRIADFGNFLRRFAPGADLRRDAFEVVSFETRKMFAYHSYMWSRFSGGHWKVKGVTQSPAQEIILSRLDDDVRVEIDGEPVGFIPAHIRLVPDAVRLMFPKA